MAAKPPFVPSAKVIELTVTVLPVPTFLLSKVEATDCPKVSEPINPEKVNVVVAVVPPSYVLLDADAVAVNTFAVIFAVVVDWSVTE